MVEIIPMVSGIDVCHHDFTRVRIASARRRIWFQGHGDGSIFAHSGIGISDNLFHSGVLHPCQKANGMSQTTLSATGNDHHADFDWYCHLFFAALGNIHDLKNRTNSY
mmetsp:Transcript_22516/g.34024  ORF Transcript_22516/g.34024 Transcript_22516/m.34024 type:complete len:108 (-) Transcript_22516:237-560(-)